MVSRRMCAARSIRRSDHAPTRWWPARYAPRGDPKSTLDEVASESEGRKIGKLVAGDAEIGVNSVGIAAPTRLVGIGGLGQLQGRALAQEDLVDDMARNAVCRRGFQQSPNVA